MEIVTVIGGGIAGLTAAHDLQRAGRDVRLLEASPRIGGVIASTRVEAFDLDLGPNSLLLTEALKARIEALGLESALLDASPVSKHRYLVKHKTLHALSPHPLKLLRSPYLSWSAKARILTERFRPVRPAAEESLGTFFTRRFGPEVCEAVVDPIFSGIYAGDIHRLSLDLVLPIAARWEKQYGSVTQALFKEKAVLAGARRIINFTGGLSRLTDALAAPLGDCIQTGAQVTSIRNEGGRYQVTYRARGEKHMLESADLLYAAPLHTLKSLPWFAGIDAGVTYSSVRTLHVTVPESAVDLPPAFGFLVPTRERLSLLGCIFTSSIFPSKAPPGSVLLTLMLGGPHQDINAAAAALDDLKDILHIHGDLRVLHSQTWPNAIPQKNIGYDRALKSLRSFEAAHPGFHFLGNALAGVSVADTMSYAAKTAENISS